MSDTPASTRSDGPTGRPGVDGPSGPAGPADPPDPVSRWAADLRQWGIPDEILARAPRSPWIHPVESFRPTGDLTVDTPSRRRALEALTRPGAAAGAPSADDGLGPSVLDVGCGGGRGAFALTPPAVRVVGVDHQQGMLDVFTEEAARRGLAVATVLGDWPDVAALAPVCDVVVCHHVLYNVQDVEPFVRALHAHARRRVVLELPEQHPLSSLSDAWRHFWGLERPTSPTADDALAVLRHLGLDAHLERFDGPPMQDGGSDAITPTLVEHTRIRLCLPADRDVEVDAWLRSRTPVPRRLATIWWDTTATR